MSWLLKMAINRVGRREQRRLDYNCKDPGRTPFSTVVPELPESFLENVCRVQTAVGLEQFLRKKAA